MLRTSCRFTPISKQIIGHRYIRYKVVPPPVLSWFHKDGYLEVLGGSSQVDCPRHAMGPWWTGARRLWTGWPILANMGLFGRCDHGRGDGIGARAQFFLEPWPWRQSRTWGVLSLRHQERNSTTSLCVQLQSCITGAFSRKRHKEPQWERCWTWRQRWTVSFAGGPRRPQTSLRSG